MTSPEAQSRLRPTKRRGSPAKPGFRFGTLPTDQAWLSTLPFLLLEEVNTPGTVSEARSVLRERERASLEYYLRPLQEKELPGREELERHVQEKYRRSYKPNTLRGTVESGKQFLSFLREIGREKLAELNRQDIEAFVERQQDRGMKPRTVKTRLGVVHAFVRFLIREAVVDSKILDRKIQVKLPENLPRAMDPADVRQLLCGIERTRDRAMVLVLLRTGMRIGELLNTKLRDVHLEKLRIEIPQAQKNSVGRVVYLSNDARDALRAWLCEREPHRTFLFHTQGRGTMGYAIARVLFQKYLVQAGLQDRGYTLHSLRHTFASEMLNAGMRLECVQQLLGHTHIEVTRRYARLTDVTREEEYFRAMEIIEKGGIHGHYQLDPELQAILEEKKLLRPHPNALPERPETVPGVGGRAD